MSNRFIAKEDASTYQRWEATSFGNGRPGSGARLSPNSRLDPDVRLPTAAEVQAMQEQAVNEGYNAGLAQAQAAEARAQEQTARLTVVLKEFDSAREEWQGHVADDVLALALEIANQVVRTALKVRPELILPLVREAVQMLPAAQGEMLLLLNATDADLVREQLAAELEQGRWRITIDPNLPPGGCRIESASGDIEASLANRWSRVMAALGTDHAWLD
jgi:flagellar assembly protein FliH